MSPESTITFEISDSGSPGSRTLELKVACLRKSLARRILNPAEASEVLTIPERLDDLMRRRMREEDLRHYMDLLGDEIFRIWLAKDWAIISRRLQGARSLKICSDLEEVLALPWELMRPPGGEAIGLQLEISRHIPGVETEMLRQSGPLRVLFCAAAPKSEFEWAEERIVRALEGLGISIRICDGGRLELARMAESFRPHLVHISAPLVTARDCVHLILEGEDGGQDRLSPRGLAEIVPGAGAIISPPKNECANLALSHLCHSLLAEGMHFALSWPCSKEASWRCLYRSLGKGKGIGCALLESRAPLYCGGDSSWALPALYGEWAGLLEPAAQTEALAKAQDGDLAEAQAESVETPREAVPLHLLRKAHLVDRRRERQRLLPRLKSGTLSAALILGPAGMGKSALSASLALSLDKFFPVALHGDCDLPISAFRIIEAALDAFRSCGDGYGDVIEDLLDPGQDMERKCNRTIDGLNRGQFLLILDDLGGALSPDGTMEDPHLARLYRLLLTSLKASRTIIVAPTQPKDPKILPTGARKEQLAPLSSTSRIRILLSHPLIEEGYRSGEIPYVLLDRLSKERAPSLDLIRSALLTSPVEVGSLMEGEISTWSKLDEDLLEIVHRGLGPRLWHALCKAAAFKTPVRREALAKALRLSDSAPFDEWVEKGLAVADEWEIFVSESLRPLLLAQLKPEDYRSAERMAGGLLMEIAEEEAPGAGITRLDRLLMARLHLLSGDDMEGARRASAAISSILIARGFYGDAIRINRELLDREEHPATLSWLAQAHQLLGDAASARKWYERALDASLGRGPAASVALHGLASLEMASGKLASASKRLEEALNLEGPRQRGETAIEIAKIEMEKGDLHRAKDLLEEALCLPLREAGGQDEAYYLLGLAEQGLEELPAARVHLNRALEIRRSLGIRKGVGAALHSLATVDLQMGDSPTAILRFREALEIGQEIDDGPLEASTLFQLGSTAVLAGRVKEGLSLVILSGMILRRLNHPDTLRVESTISGLASHLGYDQRRFDSVLREAIQSYRKDRGRGLIEAAFRIS
ncbi:MAG: tetratricopeptide repeat protein [Methanotrichaceae archaeon]|nr:tetratricopeptide repeat protein [Methanotrichaceae archaeon]